jgi:hypothetical protein
MVWYEVTVGKRTPVYQMPAARMASHASDPSPSRQPLSCHPSPYAPALKFMLTFYLQASRSEAKLDHHWHHLRYQALRNP